MPLIIDPTVQANTGKIFLNIVKNELKHNIVEPTSRANTNFIRAAKQVAEIHQMISLNPKLHLSEFVEEFLMDFSNFCIEFLGGVRKNIGTVADEILCREPINHQPSTKKIQPTTTLDILLSGIPSQISTIEFYKSRKKSEEVKSLSTRLLETIEAITKIDTVYQKKDNLIGALRLLNHMPELFCDPKLNERLSEQFKLFPELLDTGGF